MSSRDDRVHSLATKIATLMRDHENRAEAVDAHDMAKILFRRPLANRDQTCSPIPEECLEVRT
jgi:hypothetical protein